MPPWPARRRRSWPGSPLENLGNDVAAARTVTRRGCRRGRGRRRPLAAALEQDSGREGRQGSHTEDACRASGGDTRLGLLRRVLLLAAAGAPQAGCRGPRRSATTADRRPGPETRRRPDDPDHQRQQGSRLEAEPSPRGRQSASRHHHRQHRHDQHRLQHQGQAGRDVGERLAHAERIDHDQHHGLHRDPAEDVADCDLHLTRGRRTDGDRQLGEGFVATARQDEPAQGGPQVQALCQDVGVVRELDPGQPDDRPAREEDQQQEGCGKSVDTSGGSPFSDDEGSRDRPTRWPRSRRRTCSRRPLSNRSSGVRATPARPRRFRRGGRWWLPRGGGPDR